METNTIKLGYLRGELLQEISIESSDTTKIDSLILVGWRPIEPIDETLLGSAPEHHTYRMVAYDNGDTIAHKYELTPDKSSLRREIERLKAELDASDYKVVKCMESTLQGVELPYDKELVINERKEVRVTIRELEEKLFNINENEKQ